MTAVRFSVVIPTRERADTLRFALRTCIDQTFDDYEIIVSDNFSSPATRAVVDEVACPKVRYVRTAGPVAMSANWEFGVGHARGEYVTVLGDDDGLLTHALAHLDGLAREHRPKAIRWELAFYTWPNFILAGHENYLRIPFGDLLMERDGAETIRRVAGAFERYEELPMLYNAVVRRDVLDELRARTGKVFAHPIPDVYSGFAVAHAAGRFLNTSTVMSVRGVSGASNGIAAMFAPGRTRIEREFSDLNAKDGFRSEPVVPALPALAAYVADAFVFARRALFPDLDADLDRRKLVRACLSATRAEAADWPAALATARRSLADRTDLLAWFDEELAELPHTPPQPVTYFKPDRLGFDGKALHVDAASFGIADVAEASRFSSLIVNEAGHPVRSRLDDGSAVARKVVDLMDPLGEVGRDAVKWALGWGPLLEEVRARRDEVNALEERNRTLQAVCEERAAIIERVGAQVGELDRRLRDERRWSLKRPLRGVKRLLAGLTRLVGGRPRASV